jgi:hypothetical protein
MYEYIYLLKKSNVVGLILKFLDNCWYPSEVLFRNISHTSMNIEKPIHIVYVVVYVYNLLPLY